MYEPLLTIRNHHSPSCGDPPIVGDEAGDCYVGYFENRYGEQWIFTFDRDTKAAVLRGGDAGWNSGFSVIDGVAGGLILNHEEQLWLRACWEAVQT
jgi:hypothetical protein